MIAAGGGIGFLCLVYMLVRTLVTG